MKVKIKFDFISILISYHVKLNVLNKNKNYKIKREEGEEKYFNLNFLKIEQVLNVFVFFLKNSQFILLVKII
jgi:hypothetical protein